MQVGEALGRLISQGTLHLLHCTRCLAVLQATLTDEAVESSPVLANSWQSMMYMLEVTPAFSCPFPIMSA